MSKERILFLGKSASPVLSFLREEKYEVVQFEGRIDGDFLENRGVDFVISHGYRHVVRNDVIPLFPGRIINLHISLLPYNRGADPNLWSFLEDSRKGVTIHFMDEGIDTGDIIAQKEVFFDDLGTLKSTYDELQQELQKLFVLNWQAILKGECNAIKQPAGGTFHSIGDKEKYLHLLKRGWDTMVSEIKGKGLQR